MKTIICIIILLTPFSVISQDFQLRKKTDSIVLKIDSSKARIFSFKKMEKDADNKTFTIRYQFKNYHNQLVYASREFSNNDSAVKQEFYIFSSLLIFSNESIQYYNGKDTVDFVVWGGIYYFSGGKLKDYETLGHGKSENETWNPEVEVLRNYR